MSIKELREEIQLNPWQSFLFARAAMIVYLVKEGNSFEAIASHLSCDEGQCRLIYMSETEKQK